MHKIEGLPWLVPQCIRAHEMDLRIVFTLPASDLDRGFIGVDRINPSGNAAGASQAHHFTRQIGTTGAEVEHAIASVRIPPSIEKAAQEPVTPGSAIDFFE